RRVRALKLSLCDRVIGDLQIGSRQTEANSGMSNAAYSAAPSWSFLHRSAATSRRALLQTPLCEHLVVEAGVVLELGQIDRRVAAGALVAHLQLVRGGNAGGFPNV